MIKDNKYENTIAIETTFPMFMRKDLCKILVWILKIDFILKK